MLDRLRRHAPRAAELVSGPAWPLDRLRDLLQALLREGLPVRDLERIAEAVHGADARDPDEAVRRARAVGARELCERLIRQAGEGRRAIEAVWIGAEALEGHAAQRAASAVVVPDAAISERLVRSAAPGGCRLLRAWRARGGGAPIACARGEPRVAGRAGDVTVLAKGEIPQDCELNMDPVGSEA